MSLQNLFVAKLPRNINDADLLQIFSEYNPSSAKIMLDASTGKSKGFGFVLFDEEKDGEKAYKALNRKMTRACGHNFTLVIYPSNHNGKIFTEETTALYIRNIPMTVGQDRVERFLRTFGNLVYFAVREDHYGSPVWVVYAEYETVEEAKNALTKLHGNSTYFHGSAPILAKFEDSEDAKKERRRRRETAQAHVPSSGCIFPPPRDHHDGASSSLHTNPSNAVSMEAASASHSHPVGGGENGKSNAASSPDAPASRLLNGGAAAAIPCLSAAVPTPSPPSYVASVAEVPAHATQPTAFSLPQQLLQPTPGYCYTLADSGQQIFIPATSFSPPATSYSYSPVAQSAPPVPMVAANPKPTFSLLNPEANNAVVLMDGGQQYVVAPDAMNMNRDKLSSAAKSQPSLLSGSMPKSVSPVTSGNVSYAGGSAPLFPSSLMQPPQSFYPTPMNTAAAAPPSFMVTQTARTTANAPMVFMPYNAV